jgi:hypothetical protein
MLGKTFIASFYFSTWTICISDSPYLFSELVAYTKGFRFIVKKSAEIFFM